MSIEVLPSWIGRAWRTEQGDRIDVRGAVRGASLIRVRSQGLDVGLALDYAGETVGAPCSSSPSTSVPSSSRRPPLPLMRPGGSSMTCRPAVAAGGDAKVDVAGRIGNAQVCSSLGRKGLSAGRIIVRGSAEHLAREGTFMGEHILTTPRGLALQINAFDFPVWGMLEKPARTAVAQLFNTQPPLLATELQDRLITEAGRARIAGASA